MITLGQKKKLMQVKLHIPNRLLHLAQTKTTSVCRKSLHEDGVCETN
nr:hypothetical protein Iba_chr06bCG12800 [Ipomoea batatas]